MSSQVVIRIDMGTDSETVAAALHSLAEQAEAQCLWGGPIAATGDLVRIPPYAPEDRPETDLIGHVTFETPTESGGSVTNDTPK